MSVPPSYQGYPAYTQHYVRIDMVRHGKPTTYQWDYQSFLSNHIDLPTDERLRRWRAYALGMVERKSTTNFLIGEQQNLKIFSSVNSRCCRSPMIETLVTAPEWFVSSYLKG